MWKGFPKKTGKIVNKNSFPDGPQVSCLLKFLMDFQWDMMYARKVSHAHTNAFTDRMCADTNL